MKKGFVLGVTTLVLLSSSHLYANEMEVSGHANIWTTLSNSDDAAKEGESKTQAEIDFKKTMGQTTLQLDIDFNGNTGAVGTATPITPVTLEQAKFVRGFSDNMLFTGGIFNTPIGFELQDAPDKIQFSLGQIAFLHPANVTGFMWSWWRGPATLDLYVANEWRDQALSPTRYDNSFGGKLTFQLQDIAHIEVGYITSTRMPTSVLPNDQGDVLDIVISTKKINHAWLAYEYAVDEYNNAWGITANLTHTKHGVTLRYDSVKNDTNNTNDTSLTVALTCAVMEHIGAVLEWRQDDDHGHGKSMDKTDKVTLQWVAQF